MKPVRLARLWSPRGGTAIEYALLLPVLLLFMLGIVDAGRLAWTQSTLEHATAVAARCGAVDETQCRTSEQIQAYAASRTPGLDLEAESFAVSRPACGVLVSTSLAFDFVTPWVTPDAITLRASACYPVRG